MKVEFDAVDCIQTDFYAIVRLPPHTEFSEQPTWAEIANMIYNTGLNQMISKHEEETQPA